MLIMVPLVEVSSRVGVLAGATIAEAAGSGTGVGLAGPPSFDPAEAMTLFVSTDPSGNDERATMAKL
jgi:hypothetical protein